MNVFVRAIATHLPSTILTNQQLQEENPSWDMTRMAVKIGIEGRHIAERTETASDLAYEAGRKLLHTGAIAANSVDYLLFCTQSPDYFAPASACVLQHRLGLPSSCGAIDINQGCSGYIYGLHLARALVLSGSARNVLLLTGETYSKFIHPGNRQVRVLFGDAATASLVSDEGPGASLGEACLGTDGSGAPNLTIPNLAVRSAGLGHRADDHVCQSDQETSAANLFMNGPALLTFALRRVPEVVFETLAKNHMTMEQVAFFVFHQANAFMNEQLRSRLRIDSARTPKFLKHVGNTVSNSIPLTLRNCQAQFSAADNIMLVGFGVGYSWGASLLKWQPILTA